ncbi:hypothetical protein E4K67_04580 [Desulfosporosinus fructosivorans]|uniref:Uncharacterized protein n=1 Tax=Desulfosporosinus fructosivorans TaxID=2018669 RepID=A0A4Z0R6S7_9FIRM|nr:hypothetical protein [Desulfosporosinus fructosivorans]TGE38762.1 hypothetical protein E4K67_04580 [Desulfosporosinus fructosivorans]
MDRFILILLGIVALFSSITYLIWRVSPRVKLVKYTPTVLCLLVGVYFFYIGKTGQVHEGFADLANIILSMMFLAGFVSGLATSIIIDLIVPRFKSK